MPTIISPSMIRSAPTSFSAISFTASNMDAVGTRVWTVGSDLDRRIWATFFIGDSHDKRLTHRLPGFLKHSRDALFARPRTAGSAHVFREIRPPSGGLV